MDLYSLTTDAVSNINQRRPEKYGNNLVYCTNLNYLLGLKFNVKKLALLANLMFLAEPGAFGKFNYFRK